MSRAIARTARKVCSTIALGGLCVLAGFGFSTVPVRAQHLDPPLGWDIWDPTWSTREVWKAEPGDEALRRRIERHQAYIDQGVPEAYRGAGNPLPRIPSVLEAGRRLYVEHCSLCHDAKGQGSGEAGLSLMPPPALLVHLIRLPSRVDEYLIWSISEGGQPFATEMPAFKTVLDEEEIWQIITYMRAGFPAVGGKAEE